MDTEHATDATPQCKRLSMAFKHRKGGGGELLEMHFDAVVAGFDPHDGPFACHPSLRSSAASVLIDCGYSCRGEMEVLHLCKVKVIGCFWWIRMNNIFQ